MAFCQPYQVTQYQYRPCGGHYEALIWSPEVPNCSTQHLLTSWYGQGCCGHLFGPLCTQLCLLYLLALGTTLFLLLAIIIASDIQTTVRLLFCRWLFTQQYVLWIPKYYNSLQQDQSGLLATWFYVSNVQLSKQQNEVILYVWKY